VRASTLALKDRAIELRKQWLTLPRIADALDLSVPTVRLLVRDFDRERRERFLHELQWLAGYPNYFSNSETAGRLRCSSQLVNYYVKKFRLRERPVAA
jgi:hypothetical protein